MEKKLLKLISLLAVACISFSCRNSDDIDNNTGMYSNIDSLYAQPLPVIQECVQGKWKWIEIYGLCGIVGVNSLSNTIVIITKDRVVTLGDDDALNQACTFSYRWEKDSVQWGYTTYVMWNNEKNKGEWYFDKIQNDSLYVHYSTLGPCGYITSFLFKRIN